MHWLVGVLTSVVVTFLSFPPFPLGVLMLVGMVPLFLAVETAKSPRQAFFRAWAYVLVGNSAICFWVAHTMHHFANLPWILSYPCVVLLSVFEQSAWPLWAGIRHWTKNKYGKLPWLWSPALLVALDCFWPKFFPNTLGNSFYNVPWINQAADLFGVWGLTGLIVLTNEAVTLAWLRREGWKREAVTAGVALIGVLGYSAFRLHSLNGVTPLKKVRVGVVQPNINPVARVREASDKHAARLEMLQPALRLSRQLLPNKPDFIFWPETAISNSFHSQDENETTTVTLAVDEFQKESGVPLLFGARDKQIDRLYNTLFFVRAPGDIQRYNKHKLLWLGESIPLVHWIPSLADQLRRQGATHFDPGPGPMLLQWGDVKLGPMICLEGLYPEYVRRVAALGADLFVSATNDAWFGTGQEPSLHLHLTAFRAIENRRPLLRSTTTGYSALVDIDGKFLWKTELEKEAAEVVEVPIYPPQSSPFLWWGTWPIWFFAAYALSGILREYLSRRRPNSGSSPSRKS